MTSDFRVFTVGENGNQIQVTDFRDGMIMLEDGEKGTVLISLDQLTELIDKLKEGE
jgi:hypothetical protein